ncbi:MAG: hypothetical protein WA960_13480 [Tunicatimonas sp.]
MLTTNELILINLTLSAVLTGLIWTIQVVHYPGFLGVGSEGFLAYQQQHMRTISYVVIPLMLSELAATIFLLVRHPTPHTEIYLATAMVVIIWVTTMFVSSPLHGKLASQGYSAEIIERLVTTNWLRTAAWSIRTTTLLLLMWQLLKS